MPTGAPSHLTTKVTTKRFDCDLLRAGKRPIERSRSVTSQRRGKVGVGVSGQTDLRVTQHVLNGLQWHPFSKQRVMHRHAASHGTAAGGD